MRPGKWLEITDYLALKLNVSATGNDPRLMFVETVRYDMPWSLSLGEGGVDQADQLLAQMGLGEAA